MKIVLRLDDLMVFVRTAERGSLSAAARELEISPALASAAVKRLEGELGIRLFARTTRSLRLTDEGERYLRHARAALRALQDGHDAVIEGKETLGGVLKISMPSDLGRNMLVGWLDQFQALYPKVSYQLSVGDRLSDLYRQPVDIAIRYGVQDDSNLIALPLAPDNRRVLVASPDYVRRHGALADLRDLSRHNCLRFMLDDVIHDRWNFYPAHGAPAKGTPVAVQVHGDRSADDADLVRRWAVAGVGVAYKSRLDVSIDIRAGRLVVLMPDVAGEPTPLHMVCMHRSQVSPTVLALRDFLREQCGKA
ncbi:DNA-binding transcriptional LysR family regulator [Duganella sp. 3397]|uniref:LysR family transcriptional regulator n=1 Tax=Duganella sp. 3397 TaxID=2817732 RepID=UPI002859A9A3|nr:LysR family transcriptional regulator [Duganella sp. 3397]MDR7050842.1 DNA-binding transcriptional LysR family regulator [Duganella sp. 3397]